MQPSCRLFHRVLRPSPTRASAASSGPSASGKSLAFPPPPPPDRPESLQAALHPPAPGAGPCGPNHHRGREDFLALDETPQPWVDYCPEVSTRVSAADL